MLTSGISLKNFKFNKKNLKVKKKLLFILNSKNHILSSLRRNYKDSYSKKNIKKYKSFKNYRIFGMGGSILGTQAIYEFLKNKINKDFVFIDNLQAKKNKNPKKKILNLVVSKSGNTIETIVNSNILIKKKDINLFVTDNKDSYLRQFANKLRSEVIDHNNYIGGRLIW